MQRHMIRTTALFSILFFGLAGAAECNFLLAHTIIEFIGIVAAWAIFLFVWNARPYLENKFLYFIGFSYLFTGFFHICHALAFKEMNLLPVDSDYLSSQFRVAARIMEGGSLLSAFLFARKEVTFKTETAAFILSGTLLLGIMYGGFSPELILKDGGIFYVNYIGEILAILAFLLVIWQLYHMQFVLGFRLSRLLIWSSALNISSSLIQISPFSSLSLINLFGHFVRLISLYLIYRAIISTGFIDPYNLLFGNMKRMKEAERDARKKAEARAAELDALRANLTDMLAEHETCRLLEAILARAVSLLDAAGGELGLYDRESNEILLVAEYNRSGRTGTRIPLGKGIMGTVAQNQEPVILHDQGFGEGRPPNYPNDQWHSLMAVPLNAGGNLVGTILIFETNQIHDFTKADLNLFSMFAQQAAMAIRNTQLLEDARRRAETDSLTGLYNHRHFFDLARHEINRAMRYAHPLTALMFDIDHFKNVNDSFGHGVGDQVIVAIANICRQIFRKVDIVGRYGGEEFSVLLPETSLETAHEVAERLRRTVASTTVHHLGKKISVTVSMGIASLHGSATTINELMEMADQALYSAKRKGRNRVCVWSPTLTVHFNKHQIKRDSSSLDDKASLIPKKQGSAQSLSGGKEPT